LGRKKGAIIAEQIGTTKEIPKGTSDEGTTKKGAGRQDYFCSLERAALERRKRRKKSFEIIVQLTSTKVEKE